MFYVIFRIFTKYKYKIYRNTNNMCNKYILFKENQRYSNFLRRKSRTFLLIIWSLRMLLRTSRMRWATLSRRTISLTSWESRTSSLRRTSSSPSCLLLKCSSSQAALSAAISISYICYNYYDLIEILYILSILTIYVRILRAVSGT